jgi:hypothetical protein
MSMGTTQKRIRLGGDVDLPADVSKELWPEGSSDGAPIKTIVKGTFRAEIDGDHIDRLKRRGGKSSMVRTATGTLTELEVTEVIIPEPEPELFDGPAGDAEVDELVEKAATSEDADLEPAAN